MTEFELRELLQNYKNNATPEDDVVRALKKAPYEELGFAKVDLHRGIRKKSAEVIFGQGKTRDQIKGIAQSLIQNGDTSILITRLDPSIAQQLTDAFDRPFTYHEQAKLALIGTAPKPNVTTNIVVACAGTTDIPVAEEAALTAQYLANPVVRLYDVGVAGLHRILANLDTLLQANVIIAVAGMEGALPSVLAGLTSAPVIAVPTSIGYGASFNGLAALLAMLNSCASGVSVVNIDNGFGAAFQASLINHLPSSSVTA